MKWQYQTILFEFQKDGLLGDKYIDDEEVENLLNEQGREEWELLSVTPVQEGLLAFLKREAKPVDRQQEAEPEIVDNTEAEETDNYIPMAMEHNDYIHVQDQELVPRPVKKRQKHMVKGENDLVGGIRIS